MKNITPIILSLAALALVVGCSEGSKRQRLNRSTGKKGGLQVTGKVWQTAGKGDEKCLNIAQSLQQIQAQYGLENIRLYTTDLRLVSQGNDSTTQKSTYREKDQVRFALKTGLFHEVSIVSSKTASNDDEDSPAEPSYQTSFLDLIPGDGYGVYSQTGCSSVKLASLSKDGEGPLQIHTREFAIEKYTSKSLLLVREASQEKIVIETAGPQTMLIKRYFPNVTVKSCEGDERIYAAQDSTRIEWGLDTQKDAMTINKQFANLLRKGLNVNLAPLARPIDAVDSQESQRGRTAKDILISVDTYINIRQEVENQHTVDVCKEKELLVNGKYR